MHQKRSEVAYDVYGRALDPRNKMPVAAAQHKAPGQQTDLSTERVVSNIPKGGTDQTWQYPSPQMFWNALVRKGKADGAREEDMDTVVAVHNNMNELTWRGVLEWEQLRAADSPRLSRFTGRPDELSMKARAKVLFGHPPPFDRHDWIVQRGNGNEVRYIIDYYSDESKANKDATPRLEDQSAVQSILLDVRPAIDSFDAFIDRCIRMPILRLRGDASPGLPFFASVDMLKAYHQTGGQQEEQQPVVVVAASSSEPLSSSSSDTRDVLNTAIAKKCGDRFLALRDCGDDEQKCADAAIVLQHCVASLVCPKEADDFRQTATAKDKSRTETAYSAMDKCLERFAADAAANDVPAPTVAG